MDHLALGEAAAAKEEAHRTILDALEAIKAEAQLLNYADAQLEVIRTMRSRRITDSADTIHQCLRRLM